jgi:hypothetical protein
VSYELAVQTAIHTALNGDPTLGAMVTGIYDSVPQDTAYPYVTVGEDNHNEWDTNTTLGSDCTITIHTWSRKRGSKETKTIQGAIYDTLHRSDLSVTGYKIDLTDFVSSQSFTDSDGLTRHGVQTFRMLIERQ